MFGKVALNQRNSSRRRKEKTTLVVEEEAALSSLGMAWWSSLSRIPILALEIVLYCYVFVSWIRKERRIGIPKTRSISIMI